MVALAHTTKRKSYTENISTPRNALCNTNIEGFQKGSNKTDLRTDKGMATPSNRNRNPKPMPVGNEYHHKWNRFFSHTKTGTASGKQSGKDRDPSTPSPASHEWVCALATGFDHGIQLLRFSVAPANAP